MTAASRNYHVLEKMPLLIHSRPNVKQGALPIKAKSGSAQKRSSAGDLIIPALLFFQRIDNRSDDRKNYFFLVLDDTSFFTTVSLLPTTMPITAPNDASMSSFWVLTTRS